MTDRAITRRAILKAAGVATLGIGLAACQPIQPVSDGAAPMVEVTAAQVTDAESLEAFVLGAKARIEAITDMNEGAKLREGLKTEGYWKSGSTFLIIFLMNGDAFIHGNDREAERKNLYAVEDERGTRVVEELFAAAAEGGGIVEYYDEGLKMAYAVEYISGITGRRFVLVGGFSKDVSNVPITIADLPKPPSPRRKWWTARPLSPSSKRRPRLTNRLFCPKATVPSPGSETPSA